MDEPKYKIEKYTETYYVTVHRSGGASPDRKKRAKQVPRYRQRTRRVLVA